MRVARNPIHVPAEPCEASNTNVLGGDLALLGGAECPGRAIHDADVGIVGGVLRPREKVNEEDSRLFPFLRRTSRCGDLVGLVLPGVAVLHGEERLPGEHEGPNRGTFETVRVSGHKYLPSVLSGIVIPKAHRKVKVFMTDFSAPECCPDERFAIVCPATIRDTLALCEHAIDRSLASPKERIRLGLKLGTKLAHLTDGLDQLADADQLILAISRIRTVLCHGVDPSTMIPVRSDLALEDRFGEPTEGLVVLGRLVGRVCHGRSRFLSELYQVTNG